MDEFKKSLNDIEVGDIYDTYLKLVTLLDDLNKNIKELPPKEEL